MFSRRVFVALSLAVLMSSSAWAGGNGGTKKDGTITVRNDSSTVIAAFVDPDPAKIAALPAAPTQQQIEQAGGKLVNPNATVSFAVKAGSYSLAAGSDVQNAATVNVNVAKGQTRRYRYTSSNTLVSY